MGQNCLEQKRRTTSLLFDIASQDVFNLSAYLDPLVGWSGKQEDVYVVFCFQNEVHQTESINSGVKTKSQD